MHKVSIKGDKRRRHQIYRLFISVGILCFAVIGANKLLGVPPLIAIVVGGGVGYAAARLILRLGVAGEEHRNVDGKQSIVGTRWFGLWVVGCGLWAVALCAFRFSLFGWSHVDG